MLHALLLSLRKNIKQFILHLKGLIGMMRVNELLKLGWFTFNLQGEKFSYCQSEQLFGGYKGFGKDSLISS